MPPTDLARALVDAAQRRDGAAFDRAAVMLGWGWIDVLAAAVSTKRRHTLAAWWDAALGDGRLRRDVEQWVREEGREALWVAAQRSLAAISEVIESPVRWWQGGGLAVMGWYQAVEPMRHEVEVAWLNIEVVCAIHPKSAGSIRSNLVLRAETLEEVAPLVHALRVRKFSARRRIAELAEAHAAIPPEMALNMLLDAPLRPVALRILAPHMETFAERVRPLAKHRSKAVQKAALELLRAVEPSAAPAGTARDVAELEALLRADPWHAQAIQVWSDRMMHAGHPIGRMTALEVAIRGAPPEEAVRLSGEQADWIEAHWDQILGQPGGFPFRDQWRGRKRIRWTSLTRHMARKKRGTALLDRIGTLAAELGEVIDGTYRNLGLSLDVDEARAMVEAGRDVQFTCRFRLFHPGTQTLLPHQEPGHYGGIAPNNTLEVWFDQGRVDLACDFPFEEVDDRFRAQLGAWEAWLGAVSRRARFAMVRPTKDGRGERTKFFKLD